MDDCTVNLISGGSVSYGQPVRLVNAPLHERVKYHLTRGKYDALHQIKVVRCLPGEIRFVNVQSEIVYE